MFLLALELGVALHAGKAIGLGLGTIFAVATLAASFATPGLSRHRLFIEGGTILGVLLAISWLLTSWFGEDRPEKIRISPDGAFAAWSSNAIPTYMVHICPRYAPRGAFGRRIDAIFENFTGDSTEIGYTTIHDFVWTDDRSLCFYGVGIDDLPGPSPLLPIKNTWSNQQSDTKR